MQNTSWFCPNRCIFYTKQKGSLSSAGKVLPDMMNSRAEVFERYRKLYQTAKPHSRNTIAPLGYWVSVPMDGGYSVDRLPQSAVLCQADGKEIQAPAAEGGAPGGAAPRPPVSAPLFPEWKRNKPRQDSWEDLLAR